jgi:hypothetical protein
MSRKFNVFAVTLVTGVLATTGIATAGGSAPTKVTVEGTGNVYGYVESPKKSCMDDRKVTVFEQKGAKGGGDDKKVASDNASKQGDYYVWDVGNPGIDKKFYAKATAVPGCEGDSSPTVEPEA